MSHYRLTRLAEADLVDIWSYIGLEQENPTAADTVLSTLRARFSLLATQPLMGVSREEYGENLRSFPSDNYLIFYCPIDDGIEVVRVVRGGQDIDALFRG
jgi:toxin ParE1/3/4